MGHKNSYNNQQQRESSERDSIINGLNDYSRYEGSMSRANLDNRANLDSSKLTNQFNQSRASNINALG